MKYYKHTCLQVLPLLKRQLLSRALAFCKEKKYSTVSLWTTSDLGVARHLYTQAGFKKTEENVHEIWGKAVVEERYDLQL